MRCSPACQPCTFPHRHLGMNGSAVRSLVPSWEIIVDALTRINPCYVGGTSPCRSRSPLLGKHKQKRDCVLGAGKKAWPALLQGQRQWGGSFTPRQRCQSQPRAVLGTAGQGLVQATGWTPPREKCFHQSDIAGENWGFGGKCFLKGGKLLSAEVWGFVSAGNLHGGGEGCPGHCGSLMESCIQQQPQRLRRWRCYKSCQQHFVIIFVGARGKEEAACVQCWGQRAGMQQSAAPSRHRAAPGPQRFLTSSSASPRCLHRGPHRCKYERDHDGRYPPVLLKRPFHQAGRPLEAERLLASLEGKRGAGEPCVPAEHGGVEGHGQEVGRH